MDGILSALRAQFFQVAYVVRDLAAAEDFFQRTIGIPHFVTFEVDLGPDNLRLRGKPARFRIATGLGYFGDTQFEIVQPLSADNPFSEFLDQHGPGLHHIGFVVPDLAQATAAVRRRGLEPLSDGRVDTTLTLEFAFYECDFAGASIVELLAMDERCRRFMDRIKHGPLKRV